MLTTDKKPLAEFSDKEIEAEYIDRFGDPDDADLSDFSSDEMIECLEDRGDTPGPEAPDNLDEMADLIAEAARTSRFAARAYEFLREQYGLPNLAARQTIIAGRMKEVA